MTPILELHAGSGEDRKTEQTCFFLLRPLFPSNCFSTDGSYNNTEI